ncbi:MAG: SDR family NAD(P)-dependent oxidoreductase [Acidobacteria bacterium]|nr:SDR family NAD(P)-dependent oxidoreductase [Acidobacteriota bacterium]
MNRTVLVTGGTGFLGKRLGRALAACGHHVVLAGRNNKQNLLAAQMSGCDVLPLDVSHIESVRDVVARTHPSVIIHAAATKFVDLSETQPMEALDVNVLGSQNVARVAIDKGVDIVIGISTDKASPPVRNTYGLTKALMERLFCAMDGTSGTRFLCVRYGNVAWSTGSVLPIWRRMLKTTGVIQTTGPEMLRFFFTVNEAVELVLTALDRVDELHGTVLSRRMKSARMEDVLKVWTALEGARYERIEGRPGDREEEFLIGEQELPYTREQVYDGIPHYVITFNQKVGTPIPRPLTSRTAERLTDDEIRALVTDPPDEEL